MLRLRQVSSTFDAARQGHLATVSSNRNIVKIHQIFQKDTRYIARQLVIVSIFEKKNPKLISFVWWHISAITCQIIMSTCQIFMLTCQLHVFISTCHIFMSTFQENILATSRLISLVILYRVNATNCHLLVS